MIPLAVAAGRIVGERIDLRDGLSRVLRETATEDAVDFCEACALAGARVADVPEFNLRDPSFAEELHNSGRTLRDLMLISRDHDLIAREWSTDYERSFRHSDRLSELIRRHGLNDGVVRAYLEALADVPDGLVQSKFGAELARRVSLRAGEALRDATLETARLMDAELLAGDINPGSTADLVASSLFISLLNGLKF
jgi:triphosphoribosyl-dephospho-CoA synthase